MIQRKELTWYIAAFVIICFVSPCVAKEYSYYCPKGNASVVGNDLYLLGRASTPFPTNPSVPPSTPPYSSSMHWRMTGCSNQKYLCFDAEDLSTHATRRVFVPRQPKPGLLYQYGPARAFVIASASSNETRTLQVVISQGAGERMQVIKLTLRDGRGAIYIDGLNFWNSANYKEGETCVLESHFGYFSEARISARPAKVITDF